MTTITPAQRRLLERGLKRWPEYFVVGRQHQAGRALERQGYLKVFHASRFIGDDHESCLAYLTQAGRDLAKTLLNE